MELTPIILEVARVVGGVQTPLPTTDRGWLCAEGDRVVVRLQTTELPTARVAGWPLSPQKLRKILSGFEVEYEIFIDTWAGSTALEIDDGEARRSVILEIRPHEHKLGADAYQAMLAELSERSAGLVWGLSPGAGQGSAISEALAVVHPAVVNSQLPVFERLLARFVADPPTITLRDRGRRPLDLTRRADLATLRAIAGRPTLLRALRGDAAAGSLTDPREPIDQPLPVLSYNHPITRYVAHLLRRLSLRFRRSAHALRAAAHRPFHDPVVEAHAGSFADAMDQAASRVEKAASQPLFRCVQPEPIGESVLQALADQPVLGALHRAGQRLLDPGLAYGPGGDLSSSLKHTYDLFELFVLFRLVEALASTLGAGWNLRQGKPLRYGGREERPPNRAAWWYDGPGSLSVELRYQQWFSRAKHAPDGRMFTSLSGVNIPDYILVLRAAGRPIRWIILDAKYRSSQQPVDQGLGEMHRYRDALRVRGLKANGAFIVVPRLRNPEVPYASHAYHQHHSFGVLQLFAEDWLDPIRTCLCAPFEHPWPPEVDPAVSAPICDGPDILVGVECSPDT